MASDASAPFDADPLRSDSPDTWDRLVQAIGPASMLVCIENRMGAALRRRLSPEDVWQETLLHVWRDRSRCTWHGVRAFRRWVLSVAENRLRDLAEHGSAAKRGGGRPDLRLETRTGSVPPPVQSTTPSRIASDAEEATLMRTALESLPEDLREVVRRRLFEEQPVAEVAEALALGESAVKHRFRKGAELYRARLESLVARPPGERPSDEPPPA